MSLTPPSTVVYLLVLYLWSTYALQLFFDFPGPNDQRPSHGVLHHFDIRIHVVQRETFCRRSGTTVRGRRHGATVSNERTIKTDAFCRDITRREDRSVMRTKVPRARNTPIASKHKTREETQSRFAGEKGTCHFYYFLQRRIRTNEKETKHGRGEKRWGLVFMNYLMKKLTRFSAMENDEEFFRSWKFDFVGTLAKKRFLGNLTRLIRIGTFKVLND